MIVFVVWDLVADAPCAPAADPAMAVYEHRGAAVLAAERAAEMGCTCDVREMALEVVTPAGGHALPRDTWPSQAVLDLCRRRSAADVAREHGFPAEHPRGGKWP